VTFSPGSLSTPAHHSRGHSIVQNTKTSIPRCFFGSEIFLILAFFLLVSLSFPALADDRRIETIALQNRPAAEIQPLLQPLLEPGEVVTGDAFKLIVKAGFTRMKIIRGLVEEFDKRLHNLSITVLQSGHKTAEQLNAETDISASPGANRMRGLAGNTRDLRDLRNTQQLRILEGHAAHIQVGNIIAIPNTVPYVSGYGQPGLSVDTRLRQADSGFAVIPLLKENDEVILDITPWSEQFLNNGAIATQQIQTSIRTRLGEWVEIGGTGNHTQKNRRGMTGFNYNSADNGFRLLLKVERLD